MNKSKLRRIIKKLDEKPKVDPLDRVLSARPVSAPSGPMSPGIDPSVMVRERCQCCGQWRLRAP